MKSLDPKLTVKIGQKIRMLRLRKKLSQEDLALACELHRTYIGGCERGERNLTIQNLNKICAAMNVSMKDFFSDFD